MPETTIVVLFIGVGIVTGLALLAFAARSRQTRRELEPTGSRAALAMSAGMLLGAVLGAIVWQSTGEFVFWVIFTGGGMVSGLAIGSVGAAKPR
jgi:Ni/Fe-hydrogenase subunit HybB-like protein